jgi:hypothetical protein
MNGESPYNFNDYDDLMNELERGEIDYYKPLYTEHSFLGRKMNRNTSDTSIISSEKSNESVTPEPNECFNWELNGVGYLEKSPSVDDSLLSTAYKTYSLSDSIDSTRTMHIHPPPRTQTHLPIQTSSLSHRKTKALYHRMSDYSQNNNVKNKHSDNMNNKLELDKTLPHINNQTNYDTRLNIS